MTLEPMSDTYTKFLEITSVRIGHKHLCSFSIYPEVTKFWTNYFSTLGSRITKVGRVVLQRPGRKQTAGAHLSLPWGGALLDYVYGVMERNLVLKPDKNLIGFNTLHVNKLPVTGWELMIIHRLVRQPRICLAIFRYVSPTPYNTIRSLVSTVIETTFVCCRQYIRC